jgi:hypothetical protein
MIRARAKSKLTTAQPLADGKGWEASYLARKHDITPQQARDLIEKHGNNRDRLSAAAEGLK